MTEPTSPATQLLRGATVLRRFAAHLEGVTLTGAALTVLEHRTLPAVTLNFADATDVATVAKRLRLPTPHTLLGQVTSSGYWPRPTADDPDPSGYHVILGAPDLSWMVAPRG